MGRVKLKVREFKLDNALDDSSENYTKHFATKINDKSANNMENEDHNNINNVKMIEENIKGIK